MADTAHQTDLHAMMLDMGQRARAASAAMARASAEDRTRALKAMAGALRSASADILAANAADVADAEAKAMSAALIDRLVLNEARIEAIALGIEAIAALPDPVGTVLAEWTRPNGLVIQRVRGPLGVIGIIYESRPNVTADAGALCVRAANAAILRGGSDTARASAAIGQAMRAGLKAAGLPEDAIQLVPTTDRAAVGEMLTGLGGALDVVVPRGGRGLVERVQAEARVPVIGHLEGLCHTYVDGDAAPDKAVDIVVNAKMRRTGICGATETLLVDAAIAPTLLPRLGQALTEAGCSLRGDAAARAIFPMQAASEEDWRTEYLAPILAVRVVDGVAGAIAHIEAYSSGHTEAILTENTQTAERFLRDVDAAIVMHNASTQFADGGEFGMGAEIGIATGRIHARGPVGAEQLTIFKYVVRGSGQIRP
jgi:glutamate-5-semialdehyde dehydrogenase